MSPEPCNTMEPLLAECASGVASASAQARVSEHTGECAACAAALEQAAAAWDVLADPAVPPPAARIREELLARVEHDLGGSDSSRAAVAVLGGAVAAVVALAVVGARAPLASGLPLLICGAAWTATIGLGFYLASMRSRASRWPFAAIAGVGAVVVLSLVCPPPALVEAGRDAGWLASTGWLAELAVGLGFGAVPIALALLIARDARASVATTAAIAGVLLGAELPLLFAQCCAVPAVAVLPVLTGTLAGALAVALTVLGFAHTRAHHTGAPNE